MANDYLIVWADEDTLQGDLHLPFKLVSERDDILLSRPDTSTIDYFFHSNVDSNITMARLPNGNGDIALANPSYLLTNQPYMAITENQQSKITLYPNPTTDYIIIENIQGSYDIFNIQGKRMEAGSASNNTVKIELSDYVPGIYTIQTNDLHFRKFVVLPKND